ncbi:MAG: putative bifunctional diguanylate cyclase/phosphodiesterase, partial [Nitrospiraceae bacterium]
LFLIVGLMVLPARVVEATWFPVTLALGDTLITTYMIYLSGNASSDMYLTYFLIIVIASTCRTLAQMLGLSIVVCGMYTAMVYMMSAGGEEVPWESHFLRIPFLLIMATFYGLTTERVRQVSREKSDLLLERNALTKYDPLTGLPNRRSFADLLDRALERALRNDQLVGVLVLDLDDFKRINDTLGHTMGDLLLTAVSARLTSCFRKSDTVARFSGDEFGVILENISSPDYAARVAQKLQAAMAPSLSLGGHEVVVTASLGVAVYPLDASDADTLIKNANTAMNHVKAQGKNALQFFKADMNVRAVKRLLLENKLNKALESEELFLHYQPQLDLSTGHITGVEALARWQHPDLGLVPPTQFIPVAEDSGLIVPIGEWTLRTACTHAKAWHDAGYHGLIVSVNLSARQLTPQYDLVQVVARVLRETGLDARFLELELTEGMIVNTSESTLTTLHALRKLGVRLCVDDFGTGYSSLNYLKRFPLNTLKIDKAFVQDCTTTSDGALITKAIVALGNALKMKVIAEGVGSDDQIAFLRENGCVDIQGFAFSKPLPLDEVTDLLKKSQSRSAQ